MDNMHPERAKLVFAWKRNRDFCAGADQVTLCNYLMRDARMTDADYHSHKEIVEMYPAAARTLQSHVGLIFRKPPTVDLPDLIKNRPATADGLSLERLAKWALREYGITNDGGMLIDYGVASGSMTAADAEKAKLRAYVSRYSAENILELRYEDMGGIIKLTFVRLRENPYKVRVCELVNGIYYQSVFCADEGTDGWTSDGPVPMIVQGQPMTEIPFIHLADLDEMGAPYGDLCRTNLVHYQKKGRIETTLLWAGKPQPWVAGVKNDVDLSVASGTLWTFEDSATNCGYLTFSGDSVPAMERQIDSAERHMVTLGSRMLAADSSENTPSEAEASISRRSASENSILAGIARHISDLMEQQAKLQCQWEGLPTDNVRYELNTDFVPSTIHPHLLQQLTAMNQSGQLPDQLYFECLQRGELIADGVDYETYQTMKEQQVIDQPAAYVYPAVQTKTAPVQPPGPPPAAAL